MARTRKSKKKGGNELISQTDPRAPLDSAAFLAAAKPVLARLETDLIERAKSSPEVTRALEARYNAEKSAQRTAESFAAWTAALATQVAAAWLLSCVFVRTLEDRGLLKQARIAGPGAEDSQRQFDQLAPSLTARDYLLMVFRELSDHPAARDLFDAKHSLVWKLSPSAEAAKELLALFRTPSAEAPAFRFGQPSTRFLGDLYQDLSEDVRKRYALLQTPDFIESFILDRTLEPAIQRFGLHDTTLIDPTCGSGHFLLGAYDRLFEHRLRAEPGIDVRVAAVKALDAVYGADINPYAVAIARFRLTLSFLDKAGYAKLADAPALPLHLVVADSLRINPQHPQTELWHQDGVAAEAWLGDVFTVEDERAARDVLFRQYAAVVGNPPYITVKDKALRDLYREMYPRSCFREYALAAPFCERFFQLARPRGYTGQITANSFMKREFGKALIQQFLSTVNLEAVVNTSGAYIPGHGTPTVLLFGTNETPQQSDVGAVLAKRGEPSTPEDPSMGLVWRSIVEHWDELGFENDFISVARVRRAVLDQHPWSLGGGGAAELKQLLEERGKTRLGELVKSIGFMCITKQDDVFSHPSAVLSRAGVESEVIGSFVVGEHVRDWSIESDTEVLFPYNQQGSLQPLPPGAVRFLWPYRAVLEARAVFGGQTFKEAGRRWYEYGQIPSDRIAGAVISFAFVATHNHFVLDRGGKVFNRSAPIIKLPETATEDDHLALLAYLNSSTACFWMKQVFFEKSSQNYVGDVRDKPERIHYEFAATAMLGLPVLPLPARVTGYARELDALAHRRQDVTPEHAIQQGGDSEALRKRFVEYAELYEQLLQRMVVLQEEIDWEIYVAAGLASEHLLAATRDVDLAVAAAPPHARPFCSDQPTPGVLEQLWSERRAAIEASPELKLIEQPLFKRPWLGTQGVFHRDGWTYEALTDVAVERSAVELIEAIFTNTAASTLSLREIEREFEGRQGVALLALSSSDRETKAYNRVRAILERESVPFISSATYTESGLEKRRLWERTWDLQRQEDVGTNVSVPVPPKYAIKDFRDGNLYRLRGPLDVSKEAFIAYPYCESDVDGEPVYGWAGWDYLQRAHALGTLYLKRRDEEGWTAERLKPMLAGLLELIPWLQQWHNEPSAEFDGQRMGDYYENFLDEECRRHHLTHDDLRAWRPPKKTRGSAKSGAKARAGGRSGADAEGAAPLDNAAAAPSRKPRKRNKKGSVAEVAAAPEAD